MEALAFGIVIAAGFLAYGIYSAAREINDAVRYYVDRRGAE